MNTETPASARAARLQVSWYATAIFLSSAAVMILEITAGRLLAPYIGVSLYSWTSIIGVVLAGLSLGNWFGGVWADRGGGEGAAGLVLMLGAVFSLAVLLLLALTAPILQGSTLDLLTVSFLFVACLFFVPAALLGVVTPLLTTLALRLDPRTGHVVGRMHALAALGSILGTFLTGYLLIQYLGSRAVIMATAGLLTLLALPFIWRSWRVLAPTLACAALVVGLTAMLDGLRNPCDRETSYFCIRVVDVSAQAPFGEARGMVLDHLLHGMSHASEPEMLMSPYTHLMDELVLAHYGTKLPQRPRFFFAGGGAYTQPRAVAALYPGAHITVAELDPAVTTVAAQSLYLETHGMRILHTDARLALEKLQSETFDVIVGDVFHDIAVPYHLTTFEYARLVKSRLAPEGLYVMNIVDAFPDPRLVKSVVKTLRGVFRDVHVWIDSLPEEPTRMTFVISAGDTHNAPQHLQAQRGFERLWMNITGPLTEIGTPMATLPVLTDDAAPVERLLSRLLFTELGR